MSSFSSPRASRRGDGHRPRRAGTARGAERPGLPPPRMGGAEETSDAGSLFGVLRAGLLALPLTVLLGIVLLLIAAAAACADADPDRLITPLGFSALALTSVGGGVISARLGRHAPLLCGLWSGILFSALLFLLSLPFGGTARAMLTSGLPAPARLGLHAAVVVLSSSGALLGRPREKHAAHGRGAGR